MAGDDGAINTKQYVVPYIQAMMLCKGVNSNSSGKLVVPFMMLQVTPIEYDKRGNVVKQHPISTVRNPGLGDARWLAWANAELEMAPVVQGDMK
eukprot:1781410-Prymnesium_polylepis.1